MRPTSPTPNGTSSSLTFRTPTSGDDRGSTARARSLRRCVLRAQEWMSLAAIAEGFPALGDRLAWWFARWRSDGTFERLNTALRERLRTRLGRDSLPSAAIADSQTTKTSGVGGEQRG